MTDGQTSIIKQWEWTNKAWTGNGLDKSEQGVCDDDDKEKDGEGTLSMSLSILGIIRGVSQVRRGGGRGEEACCVGENNEKGGRC
jgi:hypothetical protein